MVDERAFKVEVLKFVALSLFIAVLYSVAYMILMHLEGRPELADPVRAIYWVVATMTTVGYGDIVFSTPAGYIFSILVSLTGIVLVFAFILPSIVMPWFEHLGQELPETAPKWLEDHIIVCGYGPLVESLIEKLVEMRIPFVIVESRESVARSIFKRYPTIWGEPSEIQVLRNARISSARAVIANYADEVNADIVLTIREISRIEVIAMVEDLRNSKFLSYAGASRVLSPKTMLGTFVAQISHPSCSGSLLPGAIQLFSTITLVEIPLFPASPLIGRRTSDPLLLETGAVIVGIWKRGEFKPRPFGDDVLPPRSVILAVGEVEQLLRLRSLSTGDETGKRFVVIGYGDVGRRLVRVLCECGIRPTVVDSRELETTRFEHIKGDGYSEDALLKAGINGATGIMIMLNNDHDAIYSTLVARNLNPDAFIISRSNHHSSTEKLYRAGADYVEPIPLVASRMLVDIVSPGREELTILYEGLEIKRHEVRRRSSLANKRLRELSIVERFGCTIVAIDRGGDALIDISGNTIILPGDLLFLLGPPGSVESFVKVFGE